MTAEELMRRFTMEPHVENGAFAERHYEYTGPGRAASGLIYYYVGRDEKTEFHVIDCDEYWCWSAGTALEIWVVDTAGKLSVRMLGTEEGCEPAVLLRSGEIFASRHAPGAPDGTFLSCVTVPRFTYQGFRLISEREITEQYPETAAFFSN